MPTLPLLEADTKVVDSIFKAIQLEVIDQGYMPNVDTYGDTDAEAIRYNNDIQTIINTMGFNIEVFNHSSARRKSAKKIPRIVIYQSRTYEGEIGAPVHAIISNDKTIGGKYKSGFMPQMASNLVVAIHLLTFVDRQFSKVNSILGNAIGQRQYLKWYDKVTNTFEEVGRFLCEQTSFNDNDDAFEGVFEKIYFYTVPDIYLSSMSNTREVAPIKYIKVDTKDEAKFIEAGEQQP